MTLNNKEMKNIYVILISRCDALEEVLNYEARLRKKEEKEKEKKYPAKREIEIKETKMWKREYI